jgi:hypothetical protein
MQDQMQATPRGSGPERRHESRAAQGKDANNLVIKHTCYGGGVTTADEEMIGS